MFAEIQITNLMPEPVALEHVDFVPSPLFTSQNLNAPLQSLGFDPTDSDDDLLVCRKLRYAVAHPVASLMSPVLHPQLPHSYLSRIRVLVPHQIFFVRCSNPRG